MNIADKKEFKLLLEQLHKLIHENNDEGGGLQQLRKI